MTSRKRQAELMEAALAYAGRGLPVFPCSGNKQPYTPHGFHDASTDVDMVLTWWKRWPEASIGIRTGSASGLVVLDVDPRHGGLISLETLERKHGRLPKGPQVLTGGGGQHFYFAYPQGGLGSRNGALGEGLDVKGDGGYVIAPPSGHENGNVYKWLHPLDVEWPPWPDGLGTTTSKAAPKLDEIIPEGRRRTAMLSVAGKLKRSGLTGEEILPTLRELNRRCRPLLEEHELESVAFESTIEPAEELGRRSYQGPPSAFDETIAVFTRWLFLPDVEPVYATLGAAAANYLPGAPVWLVLVGPPASGKTELLGSLVRLADVYQAATLTEASLLSGSPKREHAAGPKGGLLRELGDFGLVVLKDMGSLLSMRPDAKAETLAALREVFDGSWTRYVGTDGGRALHWTGKVGLLSAATPVIDRHHGVLAAMGERFTLCRLAEADDEQALRALVHVGEREHVMREELATAVAALFAGRHDAPCPLEAEERQELVTLAALVTRARSAVERDRVTREIEQVPGAEGPARLAITLERLLAGLDTLGCERALAWRVARRVALDCMPALRRRLLEWLCEQEKPETTSAVAEAVDLPTSTVRCALEDLTAYGLVSRYGQGKGKADVWAATDWTRERMRP